jgi:hypothetical protein
VPTPPGGWLRLAREVVVFCGAYWLYRLVRGLVSDDRAQALANARWIVDAERAIGIHPEPALNAWAAAHAPVAAVASWAYLNVHFVVTTVALAWLYLRHHERFGPIRNAFCVAMGLALVLYLLVPTAPPRLLPQDGYVDLVQQRTGVPDAAATLFNPYAAIPSMHVAFAVLLAVAWAPLTRGLVRTAWVAYPALVTAVTVLTGNHFWLDAAAGAAVAAVALCTTRLGFWRAWLVRVQRLRPSPTG